MRIALLAMASFLIACGPLTPATPDAGVDAGSMTGGGGGTTGGGGGSTGGGGGTTGGGGGVTGGGGGMTTGGGGGTTTGGGGGATGGGAGGGGPTPFSFSRMSFAQTPGGSPTVATVAGLGLRGGGDLWVALSNGEVFSASAGSDVLNRVPNFPAPTGSTEIVDVAATTAEVLFIEGRSVKWCSGVCDDYADFTTLVTVPFGENPTRLCTQGSAAALTVQQGSTTLLYELSRAGTPAFTKTVPNLGVSSGRGCQITADGSILVAGSEGVAVKAATGGTSLETVDLAGQPGAAWWDVLRLEGNRGFLVGGGSGYRFARRGTSTWTSLPPLTAGPLMSSLALAPAEGSEPEVVFACGSANGQTGSAWLYEFTASGVTPWSPTPPSIDCARALSAGARDVYFGGAERTGGYVVLHGRR